MHSYVDPYPERPDTESAALWLARIRDWFSYNNSQASNLNPARQMTNYFGGDAVHAYSAGTKGYRAMLSVQSQADAITPLTGYVGGPLFLGGLFYINPAAGNTIEEVGFSDNGGPNGGWNVLQFTKAAGVVTVRMKTLDASAPGQPFRYSDAQAVSSGVPLLILSVYDDVSHTWELSINDATVDSTDAIVGIPYGLAWWAALLNPYVGIAFGDLALVLHDETFYGVGVVTPAMRTYLYNGGLFKSYAEVVADAAL